MSYLNSPWAFAAFAILLLVAALLLARRADGTPYVNLALPPILEHAFCPDSRKVGFGYQVFSWATYGLFFSRIDSKPLIDTQTWLLCVSIAGVLIGGGTLADAFHTREMAKINGGPDEPVKPAAGTAGAAA